MTGSSDFRKIFPVGSFVWFYSSISREWEIGVVRNHLVLDPDGTGFLETENAIQVEEHIYLYSYLRQEKPPVRRIEGVK